MAFEITTESIDFGTERASIALTDKEGGHKGVHINVPLETPGNQPEKALRQQARTAAIHALQEALRVLQEH